MRVKISANPPLPPVKAWFPLAHASTSTVLSFKSLLCTSLPAFRGISPSSLRLYIDGFELLDSSELTVVRDGDLISVDVREIPLEDATARDLPLQSTSRATRTRPEPSAPAPSRKRKRRTPTSTSSGFESDTESTNSTESTTESESASSSEESGSMSAEEAPTVRPIRLGVTRVKSALEPPVKLKLDRSTNVPPGHGKPQTRARNLRRRLKRTHEREAASTSVCGPVSGANSVVVGQDTPSQGVADTSQDVPALMSLSLRSKNKAKNFRSLMTRPLPPKIIFGEQEGVSTNPAREARQGVPPLIPPSERSSLPPNMFVTSVDVEGELHRERKRQKTRDEDGGEPEVSLEYGEAGEEVDRIESMAKERWDTLEKPTRENVKEGKLVGYKALGIDPVTYTPGHVITVGRVESCGGAGLVVRPLRAVSFSGPAEGDAEEHAWENIESGDWRRM